MERKEITSSVWNMLNLTHYETFTWRCLCPFSNRTARLFLELLCKFSFEPRIILFKEEKKTDVGSREESQEVEDC